jgi:hypothetical protein
VSDPLGGKARRRDREIVGGEAIAGMRDITEETAQKLLKMIEGSHPVRTLRGSQVATAIVGTVGFALFLVGVETAAADIPLIKNGWGAMAVGLMLLAAAGVLIRRFMDH